MYYEMIVLALVCLAAPSFARFAGYETQRRPFDLVGIAGIFFLSATASGLSATVVTWLQTVGFYLMAISLVLGWISLAIGVIWGTVEVLREPAHSMEHHQVEIRH